MCLLFLLIILAVLSAHVASLLSAPTLPEALIQDMSLSDMCHMAR